MRVLLVHPGASWAVADVHNGIAKGLVAHGVDLIEYNLEGRIATCGGFLSYVWKRSKLPKEDKPGQNDVLYLASQGILEKALRHQVDWTIVIAGSWLHPDGLMLMRRAGCKIAVCLTESPYLDKEHAHLARLSDVVFTNERVSVDYFRTINPNSHYLAHSYDPEVHFPAPADESVTEHDVVFVGTGFQERIDYLAAVDWTGIDLGLYGFWGLLPSRHKLRKYLRGKIVPNAETIALYRRAKIGVNIHRTSMGYGRGAPMVEHAESVGPRVLELAASGTFFLSDWRPELDERCDGMVPTFRTPAEMEAKIRYYLAHPAERLNITARLPEAVKDQTFDNRAREIIGRLEAA